MVAVINTSQVAERRPLHFHCLEDILADVEHLAKSRDIRTLGNWSAGQLLQHLAVVMEKSIDGFRFRLPAVVRWVARLLLKRRFLIRPMAAGIRLPAKAWTEVAPPPTSWQEGLQSIRHALKRLQTATNRAPHPAFGPLTSDEWNQLHCRHAELHLSFLIPMD